MADPMRLIGWQTRKSDGITTVNVRVGEFNSVILIITYYHCFSFWVKELQYVTRRNLNLFTPKKHFGLNIYPDPYSKHNHNIKV